MRRLFYVLLSMWVVAIRVKRFFFPRGFRMIAIRRRCAGCNRRLRPRITKNAPALICKRCAKRPNKTRR